MKQSKEFNCLGESKSELTFRGKKIKPEKLLILLFLRISIN